MPQIVKSNPSQSCLPDDPGEIVGQRARVNRLPIVIGEYKVVESERHTQLPVKRLPELQEWKDKTTDYELMARIIELYYSKYGPLRVIRRDQQEKR